MNLSIKYRPDDIFLVSYPKSGNTWMRFMIANLISRPPKSFQDANNLVPDIHNARTARVISGLPSPRIIKSHFPHDPDYPRVLYLVRDPRSVCVSQFFFKKRKGELEPDCRFESFFGDFLHGFDDGFGNWGDHVSGWFASRRSTREKALLRFEDVKSDAVENLRLVCNFAGIERSDQRLAQAIANSTMEAMRRIEVDTNLGHHLKGTGDPGIPFVRKGSTKEWREYFTEDMNTQIRKKFDHAMKLAGYV